MTLEAQVQPSGLPQDRSRTLSRTHRIAQEIVRSAQAEVKPHPLHQAESCARTSRLCADEIAYSCRLRPSSSSHSPKDSTPPIALPPFHGCPGLYANS